MFKSFENVLYSYVLLTKLSTQPLKVVFSYLSSLLLSTNKDSNFLKEKAQK